MRVVDYYLISTLSRLLRLGVTDKSKEAFGIKESDISKGDLIGVLLL